MDDSSNPSNESDPLLPLSVPGGDPARAVPARHAPLTNLAKDTIAEQAAMGMGPSELARLHQRDPAQISALLRTTWMQERIAAKKEHILSANSRVMFRFLLHADSLAQAQLDCALTPNPDQYRARTWILERIVPQRSVSQSQVDVSLNINHEIMLGLKDALVETAKVLDLRPATPSITLLDGKSAMPRVDYDLGDETQ